MGYGGPSSTKPIAADEMWALEFELLNSGRGKFLGNVPPCSFGVQGWAAYRDRAADMIFVEENGVVF